MTVDEPAPSALPGGDSTDPSPAEDDPGQSADQQAGGLGTKVRQPVYWAVEEWVTGHFLPMFRRTLGGEYRWCAEWWRHGEAISRLTSLWHSWEVLRLQPGTGLATWYRDYLDQQLPILMGARGPFYQCSESVHREPHEAAAMPAPGHWWDVGDEITPDDPGEPGDSTGVSDDNA
jgi:hypothetical protein